MTKKSLQYIGFLILIHIGLLFYLQSVYTVEEPRDVLRRENYYILDNQQFIDTFTIHFYDEQYRLIRKEEYNEFNSLLNYTKYYYPDDESNANDIPVYYKSNWVVKEETYNPSDEVIFLRKYKYHDNERQFIHKGSCIDIEHDEEYFFKYYYNTDAENESDFKLQEIAFYDGMGTKFASEKYFYDRWDRLWIKVRYGSTDQEESEYINDYDETLLFNIPLYDYYDFDKTPLIVKNYKVYHYDGYNRTTFTLLFDTNDCAYKMIDYSYNYNNELVRLSFYEGYTQYEEQDFPFKNEFIQTGFQTILYETVSPTSISNAAPAPAEAINRPEPERENLPSDARPPEEINED